MFKTKRIVEISNFTHVKPFVELLYLNLYFIDLLDWTPIVWHDNCWCHEGNLLHHIEKHIVRHPWLCSLYLGQIAISEDILLHIKQDMFYINFLTTMSETIFYSFNLFFEFFIYSETQFVCPLYIVFVLLINYKLLI